MRKAAHPIGGWRLAAFISTILLPWAAHANITQATRSVSVFAQSVTDTLPIRSIEFAEDFAGFEGLGAWDLALEARQPGLGDAADGFGRVDMGTDITRNRVAFESHIETNLDEVAGIPGDRVGSSSLGHGSVLLIASFELSRAVAYSFVFSSTNNLLLADNRGTAHLQRNEVGSQPYAEIFSERLPLSDSPVERAGLLEPGFYTLELYHRADDGLSTGMHALFVVPEPGTGLLVGIGVGVLGSRRRIDARLDISGRSTRGSR